MRDTSSGVLEYRPRDAGEHRRTLPANVELEQQFLGALLIGNEILSAVSGYLKPEHFSEEIHRRIYLVAGSLIAEGRIASPVTLKTFLGDHDVGGGTTVPQYLARLVVEAPAPANARDYARAIRDLAARREIIQSAQATIEQASDVPVDMKPSEIAADAIVALQTIAETASDTQTRLEPADAANAVLTHAKAILSGEVRYGGIPTGLPDLDMRTGGFQPGELWINAGRPGQGKTILATVFARRVAEHGARLLECGERGVGALLFSLELHKDQLAARILADLAYSSDRPITYGRIMRGELDPEDIDRLERAKDRLARLPLAVDVAPALSVSEIAARVRSEKERMRKRNCRLGVVFIDYLKFIRATDRYRGLRVYEVGEITGALKQLAKLENVCIVLLVQANRAVEAKDRKDRRPGMADLRDSGDIEADADVVAFIYRESVYLKQSPEFVRGNPEALIAFNNAQYKGEIIIAKTRSGPVGTTNIWIDTGASTFGDVPPGGYW